MIASTWRSEKEGYYTILRKRVVRVAGRYASLSCIMLGFGISSENLKSFVTSYLIHRDYMAIISHNSEFIYNCLLTDNNSIQFPPPFSHCLNSEWLQAVCCVVYLLIHNHLWTCDNLDMDITYLPYTISSTCIVFVTNFFKLLAKYIPSLKLYIHYAFLRDQQCCLVKQQPTKFIIHA